MELQTYEKPEETNILEHEAEMDFVNYVVHLDPLEDNRLEGISVTVVENVLKNVAYLTT